MTTYYVADKTCILPMVYNEFTEDVATVLERLDKVFDFNTTTYLRTICKGDWYFTEEDILSSSAECLIVRLPHPVKFMGFDIDAFIVRRKHIQYPYLDKDI